MIEMTLKTNLSASQLFLVISLFLGSMLLTISMMNTTLLDTPTKQEMQTVHQGQQTIQKIDNIHTMVPELMSYGSIRLGETLSVQEFFPLEEVDDPNTWNDISLWGRLPYLMITLLTTWYITFLSYFYSRNISLATLTFLGLSFLPSLLAIGPRMTGHILLIFPSALVIHSFLSWTTSRSWLSFTGWSILSGITSLLHPWFFFLYFACLGYAYIPPLKQAKHHVVHLLFSLMTSFTSAFLTLLSLGIIWNFSLPHGLHLLISSWTTSWSQWTADAPLSIFRLWTDNTWGQGTFTTFFLQTPFPLLIFTGLGIALYLIHRWKWPSSLSTSVHLGVWLTLFSFGLVITGNGTGGYQDLLLTYVLLIPLGASTVIWLWNHQFGKPLLIIIGLWYLGGTLISFPSFLGTGNLFLRDPEQQYLGLPHQTVDHGQDLGRLALWTNEQNIDTIYVDYHGPIDPNIFLGDAYRTYTSQREKKEDQYRAVSISQFNQSFLDSQNGEIPQAYWWLEWQHPDLIIGDSILIYKPKD